MPVPKRKTSKSRRDMRSANKGLKPCSITTCKECGVAMMPHQACSSCGYYKGRKILSTKVDRALARAENKAKVTKKTASHDQSKTTAQQTDTE